MGPMARKQCEATEVVTNYSSATIRTSEWDIGIRVREVFGWVNGPRHRLDVSMTPLVPEAKLSWLPHGIVGQSFDGDGLPRHGRLDNYSGSEFTTQAMAEGAIEGVARDYRMDTPPATEFRYSRFHAIPADALNSRSSADVILSRARSHPNAVKRSIKMNMRRGYFFVIACQPWMYSIGRMPRTC
jgi:hypothetical protein